MKMLCTIGLMVILAVIFLAALPLIFAAMNIDYDSFEGQRYTVGLISSMIVIIGIISIVIVNFYLAPENFGYQKIVSENCAEREVDG